MADAFHHAVSSTRKWGGEPEDYLHIHHWFDDTSKELVGDFRHRALRHHTTGIRECVEKFGDTITLSTGRVIPVRWVAEQHVTEDMGRLVTVGDWLRCIQVEPWMNRPKKLSRALEMEEKIKEGVMRVEMSKHGGGE